MNDDYKTLINAAIAAREKAYAPYSAFKVGAALLDELGNVHTGCNVENSAYPLGFCAEANAIGSMINSGAYLINATNAIVASTVRALAHHGRSASNEHW